MKESDQEIVFRVGVELPVEMQPGRKLGISVLQEQEREILAWTTTWKETSRGCFLPYMDANLYPVTTRMFEYVYLVTSRLTFPTDRTHKRRACFLSRRWNAFSVRPSHLKI